MTAEELLHKFNTEFGIMKPWPVSYEVDTETLKNCLKFIFDWKSKLFRGSNYKDIYITVGPQGGPLFKGVELIEVKND